MKYLVHQIITKEDIIARNNLTLRKACEGGHIEMAKWLMEKFNLLNEDVVTDKGWNMISYNLCDKCFNIILCCLRDNKYMDELFGFVDKHESLMLNELTEIEQNGYSKYKNNKALMGELLIVDLTKIVYGYANVFQIKN